MLYGLVYQGKKAPFRFSNPRLKQPLEFPDTKTTVWVPENDARWLMDINPAMFRKAGEKAESPDDELIDLDAPKEPEAVEDEPEEPEGEYKFTCPFCSKGYNSEAYYKRHREKCNG